MGLGEIRMDIIEFWISESENPSKPILIDFLDT